MTKAFESIKAGLKQAIAHQQNKPNTVVLHNVAPHVAPRHMSDKRLDAQRKT